MQTHLVLCALALAVATAGVAQDHAQERLSFGADSLFGPGVVGLSVSGNAAKVRLTRPAHVVAFLLRQPAVVRLVLPRRRETRVTPAGDLWIDLPWSVTSAAGPTAVTFSLGRVEVGRGVPPAVPPPPPVPPRPPEAGPAGGTAALVIVSDSGWSRDAIALLQPDQLAGSPMVMAQALALALTGGRSDTWAAYLVRW